MFEKAEPKLFLTGKQAGAYLQETLGEHLAEAGGIFTAIEYLDPLTPMHYELFPAAAAADRTGYTGELFMDFSHGKAEHNTEVFRTTGVRLLQEAAYYRFSVFAILGGFEFIVPQFREAFLTYLMEPQPCLGQLYTLEEAEILRRRLGLSLTYTTQVAKLHGMLKDLPRVQVLNTDKLSDKKVRKILSLWKQKYL